MKKVNTIKTDRLCFSKKSLVIVLIFIGLFIFILSVNSLLDQKKTLTSKASENYQCSPEIPCPHNQYCFNFNNDSTRCISNISYSLEILDASLYGKSTNPAVYKYQSGSPANLIVNKEYLLDVSALEPNALEWWKDANSIEVLVNGVTTKPITQHSGNWGIKSLTFTSAGTGRLVVILRRTDPSNGKFLRKDWIVNLNVSNNTSYQCSPEIPCPHNQYCFNFNNDSTRCISNISYSLEILDASLYGKSTNPAVYKYQSGSPANLIVNKEYLLDVSALEPNALEWWKDANSIEVLVNGVTTKPITQHSGNWGIKSLTFTSAGTGRLVVILRRTDPSNGKFLRKDWIVNLNVSNNTSYQCSPEIPCPHNQYCFNFNNDSTRCISNISYSLEILDASLYGKSTNPAVYKYQSGSPANLIVNKEYLLDVSALEPNALEWWKDANSIEVLVNGVTTKPITQHSGNWGIKSLTFTSAGTGRLVVILRRTDPSNGKFLRKDWIVNLNVSE